MTKLMRCATSMATLCAAIIILAFTLTQAAPATPARVLVIYPETVQLPGIVDIGRGLRAALASGLPVPPRVYDEYLDFRRFPGLAHDDALPRWFAHKYRNDRPDLIVAVTALPISIVARPGHEIWPGVPIVFVAVDQAELPDLQLPADTTGITFRWPVERTITLIRQILPQVRRLIVPSGTDAFDRMYRDVFRRAVHADDGVEYVEWTDASLSEMKERLRHAPDDAAVFATMISGDREVPSMIPLEMARALSAASPRPVFGITRTHLGTGMVGGWLLDPEVVGQRGGALAVRVLQGTPASSIPVMTRPRTIEGIAGAAGIGLGATFVYLLLDVALLQPLGTYTNRWLQIGGGSNWWYHPVWWMAGTYLSWMGAFAMANQARRNGASPIGVLAISLVLALVLGAIAVVVGFPRAGWNLGTFSVAYLPAIALTVLLTGLRAKGR